MKKKTSKTSTGKSVSKKTEKKTKIFMYKGFIGIEPGTKLIAEPGAGSGGCVADIKTIDITKEAYDALQTLKRVGGSFADIMIFNSGNINCMGWMGYKSLFKPEDVTGDRDYTPTLLKSQIAVIDIPKEFKDAVDAGQ